MGWDHKCPASGLDCLNAGDLCDGGWLCCRDEPKRNELLEAVIEQEFDGDRSGLVCFMDWLEKRIAAGFPHGITMQPGYWQTLARIRATYADWLAVQAGGRK